MNPPSHEASADKDFDGAIVLPSSLEVMMRKTAFCAGLLVLIAASGNDLAMWVRVLAGVGSLAMLGVATLSVLIRHRVQQ